MTHVSQCSISLRSEHPVVSACGTHPARNTWSVALRECCREIIESSTYFLECLKQETDDNHVIALSFYLQCSCRLNRTSWSNLLLLIKEASNLSLGSENGCLDWSSHNFVSLSRQMPADYFRLGWPLTSTSFPIHCSLIIMTFDAVQNPRVQAGLLTLSLSRPQIN
jgi:hypothetical protein